MIGYLIEQELGNLLPAEVPFATILTMIEVDADDPAFDDPTKFVGPVYDDAEADALAADKGWVFKRDGERLRRVVPRRRRSGSSRSARSAGCSSTACVVICAGGGGIPTTWVPGEERTLGGVEAVIDKDLASELLAREVDADLFVMATDVDGVYEQLGDARSAAARPGDPGRAAGQRFAAGSMGPKVDAAARFVEATGKRAAIGALEDIEKIVEGRAGTNVVADQREEERAMSDFGVHSEVGQAPQGDGPPPGPEPATSHAVEPRRAPFDDVLWVERAQYEHDQFVARMRERGVEVFLPRRPARRGAGRQ